MDLDNFELNESIEKKDQKDEKETILETPKKFANKLNKTPTYEEIIEKQKTIPDKIPISFPEAKYKLGELYCHPSMMTTDSRMFFDYFFHN